MAVVSISRIQMRRGRRTELPQLASGEFGWAVDSQEIYIGNGAVSEGAPYVGNTKLLSEHDDLFTLADQYVYKNGTTIQTGTTANSPIQRTLQSKLDDIVDLASFGGTGDGTDHTAIIQNALDQLYLGASTKGVDRARVGLYIQPGTYLITNTINVPPYATLLGAGIDKTIITGNFDAEFVPMFQTINDIGEPGIIGNQNLTTSLNQSRNIHMSGMTINSGNHKSLVLDNCRDSKFEDLKITGIWQLTSATGGADIGIELKCLSRAVSTKNNLFHNIQIQGKKYGVNASDDIINNTFDTCNFNEMDRGVDLGSDTGPSVDAGPQNTIIKNCKFDNIRQQGIIVVKGRFNTSRNNYFYNVGNNGSAAYANPDFSANIEFVSNFNQSTADWFQRSIDLGYNTNYADKEYAPEIKGTSISDLPFTHNVPVTYTAAPTKLLSFAADTAKTIEVEYIYRSAAITATRTGKLTMTIDPASNIQNLTDEYDFVGDFANEERLIFSCDLIDRNSDLSLDTLEVYVLNSTISDDAIINYRVSIKG